MRPEDFEDAVLNIRKAIGNLPDTKMGQFFVLDAAIALQNEGGDATKIAEAYLAISESGSLSLMSHCRSECFDPLQGRSLECCAEDVLLFNQCRSF